LADMFLAQVFPASYPALRPKDRSRVSNRTFTRHPKFVSPIDILTSLIKLWISRGMDITVHEQAFVSNHAVSPHSRSPLAVDLSFPQVLRSLPLEAKSCMNLNNDIPQRPIANFQSSITSHISLFDYCAAFHCSLSEIFIIYTLEVRR
jgi:hypothetical protein